MVDRGGDARATVEDASSSSDTALVLVLVIVKEETERGLVRGLVRRFSGVAKVSMLLLAFGLLLMPPTRSSTSMGSIVLVLV